ncbi:MAG: hypothetical protein ABJB17_05920 [Burkholderiales bacterium]
MRHSERAHAGGRDAAATVHHFAAGLLQHFKREIAVAVDGLLCQHVLQVLAYVEQHFEFERFGALRVAGFQFVDLCRKLLIKSFGEPHRSGNALHCFPELAAGRVDLDHVALHIVARCIELLHALLQLLARAFKLAEVSLQFVSPRDQAEQLLPLRQVTALARIERVQMVAHLLHGPKCGTFLDAGEVRLQQAALHQRRRA